MFDPLFNEVMGKIEEIITSKFIRMTNQEALDEYDRVCKPSLETFEKDFYNLALIQGKSNISEVFF